MAQKIQAWSALRPRIEPATPMLSDELIENIVATTNQSRGSVLAVLAELDVQIQAGLRAGRIVHLPNGAHYRPSGHTDGSIDVDVRVNPDLVKQVNVGFRGKWINGDNIGKTEDEIMALWDEAHPDDKIS
jgi:hypothetical protein